jgi:hypothetical protein
MTLILGIVAASLALAAPAVAQQQQPAPEEPAQEEPVTYEEQVIVTASRAEQEFVNAPAAVSLVTAETIQRSPATNVGDLLRTIPGLNVTQVSARDINLTARGATSRLATSQLALVDGRSVYLDFFGMVMWDLVPTNSNNIRQIEVVRGLGRQCHERGRERHQQDSARDRGAVRNDADDRCRRLRPARGQRRCGWRSALLRQRLARSGDRRSVGLHAVGWVPGADPLPRPSAAEIVLRFSVTLLRREPRNPVVQHASGDHV